MNVSNHNHRIVNKSASVDIDDQFPIINTTQMEAFVRTLPRQFKMVTTTTSLWVCGRSKTFGFRPSLKRDHLESIVKDWIYKLRQGMVVITPLVFYACEKNDSEKEEKQRANKDDFLVYSHYNMLVSYFDQNQVLVIERYEPANIHYQGNLNDRLEKLFINEIKPYVPERVVWYLVGETGLQETLKDKTLCGHHILYWVIYRLKHGLPASQVILGDRQRYSSFIKFCECMSNLESSDMKMCIGIV